MSEQLNLFPEENYESLKKKNGLSHSEALAKIYQSLASEKEWMVHDLLSSLKQQGLFKNSNLSTLFGKMLKEHSAATLAKTLRQSSKRLPTLGVIDLNGNCLIHRGFSPKIESGYTLSDILQPPNEIGEEFFLSEKAQERILSYRDTTQEPIQLPQDTQETPTARSLVNVNSLHKK